MAEGMLEAPVIASHAQQQCARMALSGGYQQSRVNAMAFNELMCTLRLCIDDGFVFGLVDDDDDDVMMMIL